MTGFQTLFQRLNIGVVKLGNEIWVVLSNIYIGINGFELMRLNSDYLEEIIESLHKLGFG